MRNARSPAEATTTGPKSHVGSFAASPMNRPNALHTNRGLVLCPLATMHASSVSTLNSVTGQGSRAESIITGPLLTWQLPPGTRKAPVFNGVLIVLFVVAGAPAVAVVLAPRPPRRPPVRVVIA